MLQRIFFISGFMAAFLLSGCSKSSDVPPVDSREWFPGGAASVSPKPFASFMKPAKNLSQERRPDFHAGKALAHQPWVKAPTITTARDGLGPIYNARTCLACHINGGRGVIPDNEQGMIHHSFVRVSIPGKDRVNGVVPDPVYGDQLQTQSTALFHQLRHVESVKKTDSKEPPPEAYIYLVWTEREFVYPDGESIALRSPSLNITQLGYGELHKDVLLSHRNAPPIHGSGLIELIAQIDIEKLADPKDVDGDGISGRINYVWDADLKKTVPGRFGLKANRPANIRTVTAAAFAGDVGITNPLFPQQPCTENQKKCLSSPDGNDEDGVELPANLLDLTADFVRQLGVPKRKGWKNPDVQNSNKLEGRKLFYQTGCQGCHYPGFVTRKSEKHPNLSSQKIWPYSDFLLHDMGPELADHRPDFEASGAEWRTPPLWGIGLNKKVSGSQVLMHDGRARNIEEAILWHGGEAEVVKQAFVQLNKQQRMSLLQFVESL